MIPITGKIELLNLKQRNYLKKFKSNIYIEAKIGNNEACEYVELKKKSGLFTLVTFDMFFKSII